MKFSPLSIGLVVAGFSLFFGSWFVMVGTGAIEQATQTGINSLQSNVSDAIELPEFNPPTPPPVATVAIYETTFTPVPTPTYTSIPLPSNTPAPQVVGRYQTIKDGIFVYVVTPVGQLPCYHFARSIEGNIYISTVSPFRDWFAGLTVPERLEVHSYCEG